VQVTDAPLPDDGGHGNRRGVLEDSVLIRRAGCPRPESNQRTRFRKPLDRFTWSTSVSVESVLSAFEHPWSALEYR
jgi:hypothetical protein